MLDEHFLEEGQNLLPAVKIQVVYRSKGDDKGGVVGAHVDLRILSNNLLYS